MIHLIRPAPSHSETSQQHPRRDPKPPSPPQPPPPHVAPRTSSAAPCVAHRRSPHRLPPPFQFWDLRTHAQVWDRTVRDLRAPKLGISRFGICAHAQVLELRCHVAASSASRLYGASPPQPQHASKQAATRPEQERGRNRFGRDSIFGVGTDLGESRDREGLGLRRVLGGIGWDRVGLGYDRGTIRGMLGVR